MKYVFYYQNQREIPRPQTRIFEVVIWSLVYLTVIAFCNECNAKRDAKKHGDDNGDGVINNKDCALLMQYINGWDVEIDDDASDVNADGKINNKDYVLIMRYINGWSVVLK